MGLRIVHVVCSAAFAGVERYVLGAALQQAARGHRVTVIGGDPGVFPAALAARGIGWLPGAGVAEAGRALRRIPHMDVVNSHMTDADVVAAVAARRGAALVSTRHFAAPRGSSRSRRAVARAASRRLSAQIAISHYVAAHVEGDSEVIHTGVEEAEPARGPRGRTVLVAQRLEPEKHTADVLHGWRRATARAAGWRLQIAGDGSERGSLERLARELGVAGTVDFLGFVRDVSALYDRSSLLVAPTAREGLGLSVIEAMAHALPVLASDAGGHRETVGGAQGAELFRPGDADALAARLDALVADDARRAAYGEALRARQRAAFSVGRQTEHTLELYERLG
ncbi:glycosyltransferase family 4 protein [Microbacterium marinilacus]|uniref:D-inositol 3-phosphate glycosyltransferase n=1 Tax=Microbacterium marinilacus TaxID=415209 RepID=A0ABP7BPV1_9MICO|nr:glycosyltransferase family 4 protein [Microbacterium marinilacus]MBY0690064.1 glycosyltransferase family 4 protein [Microbacterium marinilacus]